MVDPMNASRASLPRWVLALVTSTIAAAFVTACASRGTPRPSDEPRPSAAADAAATTPADAVATTPTDAPERPAHDTPSAPQPRLAWVNPARCVSPCTYEPNDDLVRVDDRGVAAAAGAHRVHRSIQEPLRELVSAAHAAGHKLRIESAFRSYDDQEQLFKRIKQLGRAARAGHSEHQLGTAVDFRLPTTAAGNWLGEHAPAFGFALSYPSGKQRVTGYRPEPWHVRFVGLELAKELHTTGSTLEELFRARPTLGESGSCDDCPTASRKACGAITVAGACDGTVLQWCYDGALATVDCAASKQRCGRPRGSNDFDCLAPAR
jgi:zinc D-Ala-D-Ala carboxypeptidase